MDEGKTDLRKEVINDIDVKSSKPSRAFVKPTLDLTAALFRPYLAISQPKSPRTSLPGRPPADVPISRPR